MLDDRTLRSLNASDAIPTRVLRFEVSGLRRRTPLRAVLLMGYMQATESLKYPFLTTRDTSPSRAVSEDLKLSPSDGCPATATCLASTQALRSRRVSSASKIPDYVVAHRSDRCSSPVRPVPTGLALLQHRLRFFGLGFVDQPRNPVVFW
jgi:hypothetical protein